MKVLIYDIETSPNIGYTWGLYEQNVIQFTKEWQLLSFAYKWLGESEVVCVTREGEKSDKALTKKLWKMLNEADVVITHNGDAFDNKKASAKFIEHGLTPPKPYQSIDTKKIAKNAFKFNSNKLDDLGNLLGVGRKLKHQGFDLWVGCMADEPKAWKTMARYNKQDVLLLERVYLALRPWAKTHPLLNRKDGEIESCPKCRSKSLKREGFALTRGGAFQRYSCLSCGGWCQGRASEKTQPKSKIVNG